MLYKDEGFTLLMHLFFLYLLIVTHTSHELTLDNISMLGRCHHGTCPDDGDGISTNSERSFCIASL